MDNRNVSTQGIIEGIDYLEKQFIANLDTQVEEIISTYANMQSQGTLSSADIDNISAGIRAKISSLQNDFGMLASNLKNSMGESSETIAAERSAMEDQLNSGV